MSSVDERLEFIESLIRDDVALPEKAGLRRKDIDAVAYLGRVAFESGRFDQAVGIFAALEALEPHRAQVLLFRAEAEIAAGRMLEARKTVSRFLDREHVRPLGDYVRGLLLHARLRSDGDQEGATRDIGLARAVAGIDEEARKVLAEVGL